MAGVYAAYDERTGHEGLVDKLAMMEAAAQRHARANAQFRTGVLRVIALDPGVWRHVDPDGFVRRRLEQITGRGDGADEQVRRLEAYMRLIRYVREVGEIVQAPDWLLGFVDDDTPPLGGDCDDLAIAFHAACVAIEVPSLLQILTDEQGRGFHIRNLVGLPPTRPQGWLVIDLVDQSEGRWAMSGRSVYEAAPDLAGELTVLIEPELAREPIPQASGQGGLIAFLIGCLVGTLVARRRRSE
jgi:hypothetical protein